MEIHTLEPILKEHPVFEHLASDHIKLLVGCASNARFNAGEYICRFGEPADQFYILRDGKAQVEVDLGPRGPTIIQTVTAGDVVGWSWLFPPYKWQFDVRAIELTRAIALDAKCLRTKCDSDHDLGYELMKTFSAIMMERLNATRLQLMDMYK